MVGLLHTSPTWGRREGEWVQAHQGAEGSWASVSVMAKNTGKLCVETARLLGGDREQLYPRKNGQLDPRGGMLLVEARTWTVLHLHTLEQQGPGERTLYGHIEKKGSPSWDVSVVRQAATIPPCLEMQALIGCCVHQGVSPLGEANCWGLLVPRQGGQAAKLLPLSGGENPG